MWGCAYCMSTRGHACGCTHLLEQQGVYRIGESPFYSHLSHSMRAHLTKDAPPRRLRFHSAAPMAEPARMAAETAATIAMAQRGKVLGTAKLSAEGSAVVPAEDALPDALSGAAAEAGPAAGPALRRRGACCNQGFQDFRV